MSWSPYLAEQNNYIHRNVDNTHFLNFLGASRKQQVLSAKIEWFYAMTLLS